MYRDDEQVREASSWGGLSREFYPRRLSLSGSLSELTISANSVEGEVVGSSDESPLTVRIGNLRGILEVETETLRTTKTKVALSR